MISSRTRLLCLLELSLVLTRIRSVAALELYIDADNGADTPTCGLTMAQPCLSLSFTDTRASGEAGEPHTLRLLPGTFTFLNEMRIPNGGSWNRLVGDPTNARAVVLDGQDTSQSLIDWSYSDNNQSGPFYFEGLTFSGFTEIVIHMLGQQIDVRDCVFDYTDQHGAISIEAWTSTSDFPQEEVGSNTSTIYVDNVEFINGYGPNSCGISCNRCYNATVLNTQFRNCTDLDENTSGSAPLRFRTSEFVHVENAAVDGTLSCEHGGMSFSSVTEITLKNIEINNVQPNRDDCEDDQVGVISIKGAAVVDIDGVTITNSTGGRGAGFFIDAACENVLIRNTHFENLVARDSGGGILVEGQQEDDLNLEITNTAFINNEALLRGGAIEFEGGVTTNEVLIENCEFRGNKVTDLQGGTGGAINVRSDNWRIRLSDTTIEGHHAEFGGAFYLPPAENVRLDVENAIISGNGAALGGALHMGGNELSFTNCEFNDNTAIESGGAVYVPQGVGSDATLDVVECMFAGNAADNGGTFYANGGVVNVVNTTVSGSTAGLGGAFFMGRNSRFTVTDSDIVDNNVGGEGLCVGVFGYGAGVYFQESACENQVFDSVLFEGNLANVSGGAFFTQDPACSDVWCLNCTYEENQALGSGDTQAAPFDSFKPAHGSEPLPVVFGERFFLDATPYDAFDQPMSGNHELISAVLADTRSEIFLCGDRITTASRGLARFAFTAYFLDEGEHSADAMAALNSGDDVVKPLFLDPQANSESDEPVEFIDLAVQGCPDGFEVDMIPARELSALLDTCRISIENGQELPPLMMCIRRSNLTNAQRTVVLVLATLTLVVGSAFVFAACLLRNNRVVWSSSPFMMVIAAVGFFALEAAALLRAFRPLSSAMCMSYIGLFILGLNVLLGSSIAKNLRVWKIFTLKSLRVLHIANWKLVLGIVFASMPDIITFAVQASAFPLTVDASVRNSTCESDTAGTFFALYATLKCLWLAGGAATCWLLRKVPPKFNELKSLALLMSSSALGLIIIWGIGSIVFTQERTILEVFMTALLAMTLITITLVPKLMLIYQKRDGTLMSASSVTATQTSMTFSKFDSKTSTGTSNRGQGVAVSGEANPVFEFKDRFNRLREDLKRTQKLYERSYENTQELRGRFRSIESDLIALQFERDYRAQVGGEDVSNTGAGNDDQEPKPSRTSVAPEAI